VPGESLGLDKFFRLGLGVETSVLQEGLQRIGEFIRHRKNTRSQD